MQRVMSITPECNLLSLLSAVSQIAGALLVMIFLCLLLEERLELVHQRQRELSVLEPLGEDLVLLEDLLAILRKAQQPFGNRQLSHRDRHNTLYELCSHHPRRTPDNPSAS